MANFLPTVAVCDSPMRVISPKDVRSVRVGTTIRDHAPTVPGTWVCNYNDEWILTDDWGLVELTFNDRVSFIDMPGDKDALRGVLFIALAVLSYGASAYVTAAGYGAGYAAAAGLAVNIVGSIVINAALPPTQRATGGGANPAQVYSSSLSGNISKLDDPIWKVCGRRKITPPFACQPYTEFKPKPDPSNTGDNSDLYYYALFAVGEGDHSLESQAIGLTDIRSFADVLVKAYLPPGSQPTVVKANVTSSPDISDFELVPGVYTGAFAACNPLRKLSKLGIDIVAPQGLGLSDGSPLLCTWRVETQEIDDFGTPVGPWAVVGTEQIGPMNTATPQRLSFLYSVTIPARLQVRIVRTDIENTSSGARHKIDWTGMRGYLSESSPLNPNTAHYEIQMRASQQLNANTQTQFSLTLTGMARTWTPVGSPNGWGAAIPTRNAAWWLLDLATNPVWGLGLPDNRVDLQSFYEYALVWDDRQDRCDYVFDSTTDGWTAMQLLARTGRARVFRRNGVVTIARDEYQPLPVTAFTPRNTVPGSMALHEGLATKDSPDGVIIQYEDYRTWQQTPIECPCPGFSAKYTTSIMYNSALPAMQNPVRINLDGITGPTHALREGLYEAANALYRRTTASCTVELQGVLPAFMSMVRYQPELLGYGQSGDVAFWDEGSLVMGLTEKPDFTNAPIYLTLMRDDGSLTTPVIVTPGPTDFDIILPDLPDFELVIDDGNRERPKYILGQNQFGDELCKVTGISDGGKGSGGEQQYNIALLVDDNRVHAADNLFLPTGTVQDPILTGPGTGTGTGTGPTTLILTALHSHDLHQYQGATIDLSYTLFNDGTVTGFAAADMVPGPYGYGPWPSEWAYFGAITPTDAANYEVMVVPVTTGYLTIFTGSGEDFNVASAPYIAPTSGDAINSWLNLGTTRSWTLGFDFTTNPELTTGMGYATQLSVSIRAVGTTDVLSTATITMSGLLFA